MGHTEAPLSFTFRPHTGYDAPLVTVRAESPSEAEVLLGELADVAEAVSSFDEILKAVYNVSQGMKPDAPAPAATAQPARPQREGKDYTPGEGKVKFLRRLLDERDLDDTGVDWSDYRSVDARIEELKGTPKAGGGQGKGRGFGGGQQRGGGQGGPSQKQLDLIEKLSKEKDTTGIDIPDDLSTLTGGREGTASKLISALFDAPEAGSGKAWG